DGIRDRNVTGVQTCALPIFVKRELIEKGVATILAEEAITQYTFEVEYEKAMKWVQKKLRSSKKDSFQKQRQRIQATLMQKGFTQIGRASCRERRNKKVEGRR